MTTRQALADFVRWSKQKYPGAKRTILIINDHGSGWELDKDGKQDAPTRAILFDDNTNMSYLTADLRHRLHPLPGHRCLRPLSAEGRHKAR